MSPDRIVRFSMHRLPFDPEPLLAFFTTMENAGSVAGYLEERFHCLRNRTGLIRASFWFWRQFLFSLLSVLIEALKPRPSQSISNAERDGLPPNFFAHSNAYPKYEELSVALTS